MTRVLVFNGVFGRASQLQDMDIRRFDDGGDP